MSSNKPLLLPLLLMLLAAVAGTVNAIGYCSPTSTSGKAAPYIPNTFQSKMDMKDLVKNSTSEVQIWYDYEKKLTKLSVEQDGRQLDFYYSFKTQEIYYLDARTLQCQVFNMSKGGDLDIIIGTKVNGLLQQDTALTLFRLNPELGIKYIPGTYSVRGIAAEKWSSCQRWEERDSEFEVDWYFSMPTWSTISQTPVPLRVDIRGISNHSLPNRPFHLVYDFLFFRNYLQDSDRIFQTPRGAYCSRRIRTKEMPQLQPIMTFTWEVVNGRSEAVSQIYYVKMNYDSTQGIIRYQYREPGAVLKPPFYSMGTLTIIQDFPSGVAYFTDGVLGNCTTKPIGAELFGAEDANKEEKPSWHLIVMRSPKELFRFDGEYQYEGKGMIRGLPVNIFIALRKLKVSGVELDVTYEYYILDESVLEIAIGGRGKIGIGQSVPVELRIVSYSEEGPGGDPAFGYYERFNFFNFDTASVDDDTGADVDQAQLYYFDVGACYKEEQKLHFLLKFKPQDDLIKVQQVMNETDVFIRSAIKVLSKAENGLVNPIRFQQPKLDYDSDFVYFLATLLDKPDVYAMFAPVESKNPGLVTIDDRVESKTEKDCLEFCYSGETAGCNAVAFCEGPNIPAGKNCLISRTFEVKQNTEAYLCSVFVKPTNASNNIAEQPLEAAWNQIKLVSDADQLIVPLTLPDGTEHKFVSVSAEQYVIRPDVFNPLRGRHLKQFKMFPESMLKESTAANRVFKEKVSADECARSCLTEPSFDCKSVSYCYDTAYCRLAADGPKEDKSNLEYRARCNSYTKNTLAKFTEFPGTSRISVRGKNPVGTVPTASECAALCLKSTNETCRSFDTCGADSQMLCYLDAGHLTDAGGSGGGGVNKSECSHFSRSYEIDFTKEATLQQPRIEQMRVLSQLTQQQCAKTCVELVGSDCVGFYYCMSSAECALRTLGDAAAEEEGGGADRKSCGYFKRLYNADGSPYQTTKPQTGADGFKGFSVAAAVGIYIAVMLIGCLVGAAAFISILHRRGSTVWRDIKAFFTTR